MMVLNVIFSPNLITLVKYSFNCKKKHDVKHNDWWLCTHNTMQLVLWNERCKIHAYHDQINHTHHDVQLINHSRSLLLSLSIVCTINYSLHTTFSFHFLRFYDDEIYLIFLIKKKSLFFIITALMMAKSFCFLTLP